MQLVKTRQIQNRRNPPKTPPPRDQKPTPQKIKYPNPRDCLKNQNTTQNKNRPDPRDSNSKSDTLNYLVTMATTIHQISSIHKLQRRSQGTKRKKQRATLNSNFNKQQNTNNSTQQDKIKMAVKTKCNAHQSDSRKRPM